MYGSISTSVDVSYTYSPAGVLIEKDESSFDGATELGYANFNLQTNQVTYELESDHSIDQLDPDYSSASGQFSSSGSGIIDLTALANLSMLGSSGCAISGPDSDGDNDGDPLLLSINRQGINLLPVGTVLFDFTDSGQRAPTGWMGPNTGMLILDTNGEGVLGDGTSIIPGFGALASLDLSGNRGLTRTTARFRKSKYGQTLTKMVRSVRVSFIRWLR